MEKDFLSSDDSEEEIVYLNDTHKLFYKLHDEYIQFVRPRVNPNNYYGHRLTPPIIPESHLLADTSNKRNLRSEIEVLIRKKKIRAFNLEIEPFPFERFFMLVDDYVKQLLSQGEQVLVKFAEKIVPDYIKTTITEKELSDRGFTKEEIKKLVNLHALCMNRSEYFIGIPASNAFIEAISNGRKEIIGYLKKSPDALRSAVEGRYIETSIYYSTFQVKSLLGLGVISITKSVSREDRIHLVYDPYSGKKKY